MRKKLILGAITLGLLIAVPVIGFAGYAPADRQTYQCITPTNCPGADHVTFNSFTNAPNYGDERAFFDAKDNGITTPGGYQDKMNVTDGQTLVMRVYVHNNANPKLIGDTAATAKNTKLQVLLPTAKKSTQMTAAMVTADNATPKTVSDTVELNGANPFTLMFDKNAPVQITYRPNGTGDWVTRNVPSYAFANDQTLNANFGDWKGCFEYSALVTFKVKVKMDENPPVTPAYKCDALTLTKLDGRAVRADVKYSASGGAKFKSTTFDFGDGTSPLVTDKTSVEHTYAKDGTYKVKSTILFDVNGKVESSSCTAEVTFSTPPTPPTTPPTTPPAQELPNTGAGEVVGIVASASAVGTAVHYGLALRRSRFED